VAGSSAVDWSTRQGRAAVIPPAKWSEMRKDAPGGGVG
jgi:hypothetical protein